MAQANPAAPAKMQEILGPDLVVGEEYYVLRQEKNPHDSPHGYQWENRVKYSGTYTGRFSPKLIRFIVIQIFVGKLLPGPTYDPITYNTPTTLNENFRSRFYKKTDIQKIQEMRDKLQKRKALAKMYEGDYFYEENPGWRYKWYKDGDGVWRYKWYRNDDPSNDALRVNKYNNGLGIHQYVGNDGQPQFARDPDGKSYLDHIPYLDRIHVRRDGGRRKRTLRRASKSKKRRSATRSKKRRARANKRKKTRRTKR